MIKKKNKSFAWSSQIIKLSKLYNKIYFEIHINLNVLSKININFFIELILKMF